MRVLKVISVKKENQAELIRTRLSNEVYGSDLELAEFCLRQGRGKVDLCIYLQENVEDQTVCEIIYGLANGLSDIIISDWEPEIVQKVLHRRYGFLEPEEMREVIQLVTGKMSPGDSGTRMKIRRKSFVFDRLFEYLKENDHLLLNGFIVFRLKEYINSLKLRIEDAVNDVLISKDYEEWTEMLQDLSLPQLDSQDVVHISVDRDGIWRALDEIDENSDNEFEKYYEYDRMDYPDSLIADLIIMRPKNIILHISSDIYDYDDVIDSLNEIFPNRVSICSGCHLCDNQ